MRIKRYAALLAAAALALALAGCGVGEKDDGKLEMTIAPAQLGEEETRLAELLALEMESYRIFQFQAEGAKTIQFNLYELVDGAWSPIQGGKGERLSAGTGRLALTFGKITDGLRAACQTEGQVTSASIQPEPGDDVSAMTFATSTLEKAKAIELEREIPLVVQVVTSKQEIRYYDVDYFEMPREYAKHGYEHVYAVTVTFSEKESGAAADAASTPPEPAD